MDPALLKDQLDFKRRASATPSAARPDRAKNVTDEPSAKKPRTVVRKGKGNAAGSGDKSIAFDYKSVMSVNAAAKFSILHRVVDYMKKRHLDGNNWGLALNEIFQELLLFDVDRKTEDWLNRDALPKNPRISVDEAGKFIYKPPYKVKGKNSLLGVLKRMDLEGKGGVLLSELNDSMSNAEKAIEALGDDVIIVNTNLNKRKDKVLYFNDKDTVTAVDEEFVGLWRSAAVEHLDENKIDEYLQKHGITSMADTSVKKKGAMQMPKRKANKRRGAIFHNEHMEGILEDFSAE